MENQRIKLVAPSMQWLDATYEAIQQNFDYLSAFLPWVQGVTDKNHSAQSMKKAIYDFELFENELRFSIIRKEDNKLLGKIGLIIRNKAIPFFEIGYWLRSDATGHGYMSDAVKLLENYAFTELQAKRVEIRMAQSNLASKAVAERCGYHIEGILRNESLLPSGEINNTLIYGKCEI